MPLPTGKHIGFTSMSSISPRWTSFARTHMFKRRCPKQQPTKQGLCSNCRPSLDDSPRRSLQHFGIKLMDFWLYWLRLGKKINLGFIGLAKSIWICIESSFFRCMVNGVLGKATAQNHQEQPTPDCNSYARCAFCNLSNNTFNATVCTVDAACWLS